MISRAVDAWSALTALSGTRARITAQVVIALGYAISYGILRQLSNDQWYLPAGLRVAALLLTPYRFWGALFAGEVGALADTRLPYVESYGLPWYFGSLLPVWPPAAFIVHQVRRRTSAPKIGRALDAAGMAVGGVLCAEAVTLVNKACSALLRHDVHGFQAGDLIVYSLGDLQAILLATLGVALFKARSSWVTASRTFAAECAGATAVTIALALAIMAGHIADQTKLDGARLLLLVPTIVLSLRHGWKGAAVGAIASNLALGVTIPHLQAGQSDSAALIMQEVFIFLSYSLLVLGAKIRDTAATVPPAFDAKEARRSTKQGFAAAEAQMRDKALRAEAMQDASRGTIEPVIALLRRAGQSEAALGLIGATHQHSAAFRRNVIDEIYPLSLERKGLYATLSSDAFRERFLSAECVLDLTGSPKAISLETLLSGYRIICEAVDYLLAFEPDRIHLRVRCSSRDGQGHLSVALWARDARITGRSSIDTARLARLRTRAEAYDGSFHNRQYRLRVILVDDA